MPPPWATPPREDHSHHSSGASSRPTGTVSHSEPRVRPTAVVLAKRAASGTPSPPTMARIWKSEDPAPAADGAMPSSSASRLGSQAVTP